MLLRGRRHRAIPSGRRALARQLVSASRPRRPPRRNDAPGRAPAAAAKQQRRRGHCARAGDEADERRSSRFRAIAAARCRLRWPLRWEVRHRDGGGGGVGWEEVGGAHDAAASPHGCNSRARRRAPRRRRHGELRVRRCRQCTRSRDGRRCQPQLPKAAATADRAQICAIVDVGPPDAKLARNLSSPFYREAEDGGAERENDRLAGVDRAEDFGLGDAAARRAPRPRRARLARDDAADFVTRRAEPDHLRRPLRKLGLPSDDATC